MTNKTVRYSNHPNFGWTSTEDLKQQLEELELEIGEIEQECLEQLEEARQEGNGWPGGCDYVADDLNKQAWEIRREIMTREGKRGIY